MSIWLAFTCPSLAVCYLVNMLYAPADFSAEENIVENGRHLIPLIGVADLEPGALLGTYFSQVLRVPWEAVLPDTPTPSLHAYDPNAYQFLVPDPVFASSINADHIPPPWCLDYFVYHLRDETVPICDESAAALTPPVDRSAFPAMLERLSADQHTSFLQVWSPLPSHMREIALGLHGPGWTPTVITQLGSVLAEFSDVFRVDA